MRSASPPALLLLLLAAAALVAAAQPAPAPAPARAPPASALASPAQAARLLSPKSAAAARDAASPGGDGKAARGAASLFGNVYVGDATYYGDAGAYGTCAFSFTSVQNEAWARGTAYRVAMNYPQFYGSEVCGLCLKFRGLGPGSGANPVGTAIRYVLVSNQCPECRAGDLDQELAGDGRWRAGWTPVQCAVGSAPVTYSFQASHQWYLKMLVSNTRVPVRTVHWFARDRWWPMARSSDNHFVLQAPDGVAWTFPSRVRLVSIFGDVVFDTVATSSPTGKVRGAVQFPVRSNLESVAVGGRAEDGGQGGEEWAEGAGNAFAAAAAAGRRDVGAAPLRGGRNGEGLPAGLGFTLTSAEAAAAADGDAAAAANATEAAWPFGVNEWPPGWGGVGGGAPLPPHLSGGEGGGGQPPTHPPYTAGWWPGPPGPVYPPSSTDTNSSSPGRVGSGPAGGAACLGGVETGEQCGGSGGACGPPGAPTCVDGPWPGLCCVDPGARCVRYDGIYWGCRLSPFPANSGAEGVSAA